MKRSTDVKLTFIQVALYKSVICSCVFSHPDINKYIQFSRPAWTLIFFCLWLFLKMQIVKLICIFWNMACPFPPCGAATRAFTVVQIALIPNWVSSSPCVNKFWMCEGSVLTHFKEGDILTLQPLCWSSAAGSVCLTSLIFFKPRLLHPGTPQWGE